MALLNWQSNYTVNVSEIDKQLVGSDKKYSAFLNSRGLN